MMSWGLSTKVFLGTVLAGLCALLISPAGYAAPCYVTPDPTAANAANTGVSWATATSLQSALGNDPANPKTCTEIWAAKGVYKPTQVTGASSTDTSLKFLIKRNLKLYGGFNGTESTLTQRPSDGTAVTILSGDIDNNDTNTDGNFINETWNDTQGTNSQRIVQVDGSSTNTLITSDTLLEQLTITGSQGSSALYCAAGNAGQECNPTISHCTFSGNGKGAGVGGAIHLDTWSGASNPLITHSTFSGNTASSGGAIYIANNFQNNTSSSRPIIRHSTFTGNHGDAEGGAIHVTGTASIQLTIDHSTFHGNDTNAQGGALHNRNGAGVTATASIFYGNSGLSNLKEIETGSTVTLTNSILAAGGCNNCTGSFISTDPKLKPLAHNGGVTKTMALDTGSSAINAAGNCAANHPTDQRDVTRPQGTACDIGAVEVQGFTLSVTTSGTGTVSAGGSPTPLQGAISNCSTSPAAGTCSAFYAPGANVTLSASPVAGHRFSTWGSSPCTNSNPDGTGTCTVTLSQARSVSATFVQIINGVCNATTTATATVTAPGGASTLCTSGTPSINPAVSGGTPPGSHWVWSCDGSNTGSNASCSAPRLYTITPQTSGPANSGTFGCNASTVTYNGSTACTASPNGGYRIASVIGCGVNTGASASVVTVNTGQMSANCTITATFEAIIAGACGSANGQTRTSAPSTAAELCTTGTPGAVTGTWNWSCNGANGGTSATCSASIQTYSVNLTIAPPGAGTAHCAPSTVPHGGGSTCSIDTTSTGYTFNQWGGHCSGATCSLTSITATQNVTANFTANSYNLNYNGNNNTGGSAPAGSTPAYNSTVTVSGNTGNLVRTGYTFGGWNTAADGSGTRYSAGNTFFMPSNALTLFAQWTPDNQTLTYNGNSNTGGSAPIGGNPATGTSVNVAGAGTLTRTGYTFGGWNTAADGSGTAYPGGSTFTMPSNALTLYAQWTGVPQPLTYAGNGNTGGSAPTGSSPATGTSVNVAGAGTLTRTGYTFGGWNTAADGSGTSYAAGSTFPMPPNGLTLYAQWMSANSGPYTVGGTVLGLSGSGLVLQNNGGNNLAINANGVFTFTTALTTGSAYAVTVFTQPTGQTCTVSNGSGTVSSANITNITLNCAANTHAITINTPTEGGNVSCTSNPIPQGGSATCTATPKPGYTFSGWSGDCTGTGICSLTNVTSAKSVTASFTQAVQKTYTGPTGTGNATATVSGGGDTCGFSDTRFISLSSVAAAPPVGYQFPQGLFKFTLSQCTVGSTVTLSIRYPAVLPEGARYWKYGPTPNQAEHWYPLSQASINGDTVAFNITDGGLGDNDLKADGTISDPSGPAVPATDIPTLSEWAMLLLASLLLLSGAWYRRWLIG